MREKDREKTKRGNQRRAWLNLHGYKNENRGREASELEEVCWMWDGE